MPAKIGDTVRVHYTGTLKDGTRFDSSEDRDPLEFKVGEGDVISGFEKAIVDLEPGGTTTVTVPVVEAYGPRNPQLVHSVSLSDFDDTPYLGGIITLVAPDGTEMQAQIIEIEGDDVKLDFNHPLAGEDLTFDIQLVEIVEVPPVELIGSAAPATEPEDVPEA
jgi:peptidylprolyl isomerase